MFGIRHWYCEECKMVGEVKINIRVDEPYLIGGDTPFVSGMLEQHTLASPACGCGPELIPYWLDRQFDALLRRNMQGNSVH